MAKGREHGEGAERSDGEEVGTYKDKVEDVHNTLMCLVNSFI